MTKFYNLSVTGSHIDLEKSAPATNIKETFKKLYNKLTGKSNLESKTENHKEKNIPFLEKSSSVNLDDFKNHEAINSSHLSNNQKKSYFTNYLISL